MKEKVLGLDLGTNSIGWAVVERDRDSNERNLAYKGVHIFQEGVKIEKGVESSKAAERTSHRALRRSYFRRRLRKIETLRVLSELKLCPPVSDERLRAWQRSGEYPLSDELIAWQRTDDSEDRNPYYCRHLAANTRLDPDKESDRHIIGRALYHIAQRRGFLSNRLETTKESQGAVKEDIDEITKAIKDKGCATLGDYFYHCYREKIKIRKHYTSRKEHYEAEFDVICAKQQISPADKKKLWRAIFYQRPLRSQKGLVGHCTFERGKARCPESHPRYERYRMLCFINNIKIKTPSDDEMRPLSGEEREKIMPLFLRKADAFDFEDIAKKISGKGNYAYFREPGGKPYLFNYKMNTSVSGMPVTAQFAGLFGDDWEAELERRYAEGAGKTRPQIVNDVWHALFSFDDDEMLEAWGRRRLGLDDEEAGKFVKIKLPQDYAALSLKAINKIIPFLERGMIYSHAVFLANMGAILPRETWANPGNRATIEQVVIGIVEDGYDGTNRTTLQRVIDFLRDNFTIHDRAEERLYHPSMIDTYPKSQDGLLGSPRTMAVRNPMAMRTLFQLRRLVNTLIREGKIDRNTKIHIELSRELNNANMRAAIGQTQRDEERKNKVREEKIRATAGFADYRPTADDLLKYKLWEEQNCVCLYTGNKIGISDFIGGNPKFDIEHTIPRSFGGDDSQMNKTLADSRFNREDKRNKMPSQLVGHADILTRIDHWKKRIEELESQIEKNKKRKSFSSKEDRDKHITRRNALVIELKYWRGKYGRFVMTEVPEGFRNSQGVDAGIISKYAKLYLKSLFERTYAIKGGITDAFRHFWGLQDEYEKKNRSNHVHHCIDAITIACIGKWENDRMSHYYEQLERYEHNNAVKPHFEKPWPTFTEDIKGVEQELLVSHYTADNMGKHTRKKVRVRGKVRLGADGQPLVTQGDTARGSLHQDTYYGAILRDGELKYVVRKQLSLLKEQDIVNIVDDVVRQKIEEAVVNLGFKEAMASTIYMNEEKGVEIKKVRCYANHVRTPLHIREHRDRSRHEHKRQFHVVNDGNYMMAVYEGTNANGKVKRALEIVNNIDAAAMLKISANPDLRAEGIVPDDKNGLKFKFALKTGTMVLFYKDSPEEIWELEPHQLRKRLYKLTKMSANGQVMFRFHQEARIATEMGAAVSKVDFDDPSPSLLLSPGSFNMLVQDYDFELTISGEVKPLRR